MWPSGLREAVGIKSRIHFLRYYMTPLLEKGLVARTNPGNPMSPMQEYCINATVCPFLPLACVTV